MTKNPSTTFFWNDWDNDEALKACSLAAQGLWMRCLCIAARSPEPGVVMIGEFPASRTEITPRLAVVVGQPLDVVNALIDELLASGTAGLDRRQRIINRRMLRAAAIHQKRSAAGKNGADVTNRKKRQIEGLPRQNVGKDAGQEPATQPANDTPSSSLQDSSASIPFDHSASAERAREPDAPTEAAATTGDQQSHPAEDQTVDLAGKPDDQPDDLAIPPELKAAQAASRARKAEDEAYRLWSALASELGWPDAGFLNSALRPVLAQRLAECGIDGWERALTKAREAKYLRNDDGTPKWWVNLKWFVDPGNFTGLLENRYRDQHRTTGTAETFDQRRIREAKEAIAS